MHISDGILDTQTVIVTSVLGFAMLVYSVKNLKNENIAILCAMGAMFFVASFIHIPIGPTQIHLVLIGVIGVVLGSGIFLAIFIALLLQALLLGYGGLTSLGANLIIMALPGYLIHKILNKKLLNFAPKKIKYFLIGFIPVFLATLLLALVLILAKSEYLYLSLGIIGANTPAMIIEGLITIFLINYINKAMPNQLREI